jgi:predicted DNA-binding transcriptional regulator
MLELNAKLLRQSILRIYDQNLDDATRQLINDERNVFKLILFSGLCRPDQGIDNTFPKLNWIMHNVSNGLASAFMNFPQNIQNYNYLVELQSQFRTTSITEAHAIVFRSLPERMKTASTLQVIVTMQITLSHAWVFSKLQTSNPMEAIKEISKIIVSEDLDRVFSKLNSQEQTIENLRSLSGKVFEWHLKIFYSFRSDFNTIAELQNILTYTSQPSHYYLKVFLTFPMRERTPNTFNQLMTLKFSEWQAVRFTTLTPEPTFRDRTFLEFKMMLPSPLNAFNAVFKEAMLTTVIRKDVVPLLRKYNVSEYDKVVYDVAPIISKTIVIFIPTEVVTTFSSYVLRAGLPDSKEEAYKVGMLFVASSFLSVVPKFHPIMKCLSIINSLYLANSMASEQKSIDSIFIDIKNHSTDPISIGSLIGSVAYYGFGLTMSASSVWGIGAFITATVVNEALDYYYESQDPLQTEQLLAELGDLSGTTLPEFSNISYFA